MQRFPTGAPKESMDGPVDFVGRRFLSFSFFLWRWRSIFWGKLDFGLRAVFDRRRQKLYVLLRQRGRGGYENRNVEKALSFRFREIKGSSQI